MSSHCSVFKQTVGPARVLSVLQVYSITRETANGRTNQKVIFQINTREARNLIFAKLYSASTNVIMKFCIKLQPPVVSNGSHAVPVMVKRSIFVTVLYLVIV